MYRGLTSFTGAAYLLVGIVLTVVGPLIPDMRRTFGVGYGAFGSLFLLNSLAYLPAVLAGGAVAQRRGARLPNTAGLAAMSAGYLLVATSTSWPRAVAGFFLAAAGFGVADAGINALMLELGRGRQGSVLNWLHLFPAAGAVAGPFLARGLAAATGSWQAVFALLAALFGLAAAGMALFRFPPAPPPATGQRAAAPVWGEPLFWGLGAAMLAYVGAELGLSNWTYPYLVEVLQAPELVGATLNSLFWAGLGLGRLASARLSEAWGYEAFVAAAAAAAAVALTPGLLTRSVPVATASFFLTGLGFAGIFPTLLAIGGRRFPQQSGAVSGGLIFCSGLGGMLFPSAMGYVAEGWGVRAAMGLAYGAAAALAVVATWIWLTRPR